MYQNGIYKNGDVIIADDKKGILPSREYHDNIKDVLVKEKTLDNIDNEIEEKIKKGIKLNMEKDNMKKNGILPVILPLIACYVLPIIFKDVFLLSEMNDLIANNITFMDLLTKAIGPVFTAWGIGVSCLIFSNYNKTKKEIKLNNAELNVLSLEREKINEEIQLLQKYKTKNAKPEEDKIFEIDCKKELEEIKTKIEILRDYYFNNKKYDIKEPAKTKTLKKEYKD